MVSRFSLILLFLLSIFFVNFKAYTDVNDQNDHNNDPALAYSQIPNCNKEDGDPAISVKPCLNCKIMDSTIKDLVRIQILHRRLREKQSIDIMSQQYKPDIASEAFSESSEDDFSGNNIMATLVSGASFGSGEYFIDMFVGTPPKHVWLILDTGSDLNWIQCVPCHDCFNQIGPHYDSKDSSSYKDITCNDPRCSLVSSPDPLRPCDAENQTCPYFYDYGDGSSTTGDFALEKFTVNLTWPNKRRLSARGSHLVGSGEDRCMQPYPCKPSVNVMFGCGHWNKGLFKGAAGILGLGRGPLSFASQMKPIYGNTFSYCLGDMFSNTSVSSKLVFGLDKELLRNPNLNFTSLLGAQESPDDTFYYLQIKSIMVGGELLDIPQQTWHCSLEDGGGAIIDSGSTLTFFPSIAYDVIKEKFKEKIELDPIVVDDFVMDTCYNVSRVKEEMHVPEFGIHFADGAVWNFPKENYLYQYEPGEVICLAILKNPHSEITIIGNLMQQNFHILYDTEKYRLGYCPMRCDEV